jgi:hypothetical protein
LGQSAFTDVAIAFPDALADVRVLRQAQQNPRDYLVNDRRPKAMSPTIEEEQRYQKQDQGNDGEADGLPACVHGSPPSPRSPSSLFRVSWYAM